MNGHHLILGEITDYITGEALPETHDEQYRQKLLRFLVEKKGYAKSDLKGNLRIKARAGEKAAIVKVEIAVYLEKRICMIVKYGPGSIETRIRPALAASRLLAEYQIPVVVVTNGEDARVIDGESGGSLSSGLDSLPSKAELEERAQKASFETIPEKRAKMESRILYAYEVDDSCPCDDTICRL